MTRVCLIGDPAVVLRYELLSRETSREALSTYDLAEPFENSIAVDTVSIGAAVSLLNDLQWYLVRFVDEALVLEPSVSETEWLSRDLARVIRADELDPEDSGEFLKVFGVIKSDRERNRPDDRAAVAADATGGTRSEAGSEVSSADSSSSAVAATDESPPDEHESSPRTSTPPTLVEPLYVRRVDGEIPEYDLHDIDDTLVVRVTEGEFE